MLIMFYSYILFSSLVMLCELCFPQLSQENILAAGGEFEGIRILDIEKEQCLQTVKGHASR